jgi:hypothetical protein
MVRLSANRHSFAIVECNSPELRDTLLARLVDQLPGLRVVRVTKETYSILDTVVAELGTDRPPAVMIVGIDTLLEGVQRHEPALSRLNYSRDGWRQELSCPTVFWLPTFAAIALTRDCGDLLRMIPTWYHFEVETDFDLDRVPSPRQDEELTIAWEEDRRERAANSFAMVPLRSETRNKLEEFEQALDRRDTSGAQHALRGMGDIVGAGKNSTAIRGIGSRISKAPRGSTSGGTSRRQRDRTGRWRPASPPPCSKPRARSRRTGTWHGPGVNWLRTRSLMA